MDQKELLERITSRQDRAGSQTTLLKRASEEIIRLQSDLNTVRVDLDAVRKELDVLKSLPIPGRPGGGT